MKLFGFWGLFDPKVFMNDFLANSQYTIAHVAYKSLNSPLFHILTVVLCLFFVTFIKCISPVCGKENSYHYITFLSHEFCI